MILCSNDLRQMHKLATINQISIDGVVIASIKDTSDTLIFQATYITHMGTVTCTT
jgi:hypothetical protein